MGTATALLTNDARAIVYRTRGRSHGPITRLVSPGDLGELIKPFVFLDFASFDSRIMPLPMDLRSGWHPHSGIATVTVMLEGDLRYADSTGKEGELRTGSVEWMRSGGGVWHTGASADHYEGRTSVFQLWVALPPEIENGAAISQYVNPKDVPDEGPVRVILGEYGQAKSTVDAPPMTYLHVKLEHGQRWTFRPPAGHTVAWIAVNEGVARTSAEIARGEMAIFEPSQQAIDFVAEGRTSFVLGSAAKHPHRLHLGNYSVHTSAEALRLGEKGIRRIGQELRANGTI